MAEKNIKVVIAAEDKYSAELSRFKGNLGGVNASTLTATAAFAAMGLSIGGVIGFFKMAIEGAAQQEAAEKKLATALGYTSTALLAQATALQHTTTFSDDQIINAQALIASFTHSEEQTRALTQATLDLASAKEMDLASAAELVAKSLGSETNALARMGIKVSGAANSSERLSDVTEGIARLYGGQAAAAADTFGGKIIRLKDAFGDMSEAIGGHITQSSTFRAILEAEIKGLYDLGALIQDIGKHDDASRMDAKIQQLHRLNEEITAEEEKRKKFGAMGALRMGYVWEAAFGMSDSAFAQKKQFIAELKADLADTQKEAVDAARAKSAAPAVESEAAANRIKALTLETQKLGATKSELAAIEIEEFKRLTENKAQIIDFTQALEDRRKKEEDIYVQKSKQDAISAIAKGEDFKAKRFDNTLLSSEEMDFEKNRISDFYNWKIIMLAQAGQAEKEMLQAQADEQRAIEKLKWQQMVAAASMGSTTLVNLIADLQTLFGKKNRALFEAGKAFAIADAQIKGGQIVMNAWNDGAKINYWYGIALAAAAAIGVAARVKQIQDTKFDSGSSFSSSMGGAAPSGGSTSITPSGGTPIRDGEAPVAAQQITLIINNPLNGDIPAEIADAIVAAVNGAAERNVNVTVKAA